MTYAIKMARAMAPAIDRMARRLYDGGYGNVMDGLSISYRNTQCLAIFASEAEYKVGAGILAEELRADGWGWSTKYDNNNAITGKPVGLLVTHPSFITKMGDEAQGRPSTWRVGGPMPGPSVHLTAGVIEQIAQEAAEVVRDMLRQRALTEFGQLPVGTFDLPVKVGNPLETQFDRDTAEHNEEPVTATPPRGDIAPRPLVEAFGAEEDGDDD